MQIKPDYSNDAVATRPLQARLPKVRWSPALSSGLQITHPLKTMLFGKPGEDEEGENPMIDLREVLS